WGQMVPGFVLLLAVWDPFALSAARYVIAAPIMFAVLWITRGIVWPSLREAPHLALLGVFGMGGLIGFYTFGIAHSNPVTAIVVQTATPLTYTAFARLIYREPIPRGLFAALLLVVPGGMLLAAPIFFGGEVTVEGGEFFLIAGSLCWAWYSLQCRRWLPHYDEIQLTTWTMVAAMPFLVLLFLALWTVGLTGLPETFPPLELNILMLWLILTSTCIGIMLWHASVGRLGVATAGLYFNVAPLVALAISAALGYVPTLWQMLGGALVLAGITQLHVRRYLAAKQSGRPA
ncbi:MAG: DMT family transporter, partial [Pseudomonadota bacterium]